jgi:hypothetical protein
MLNQTIANDVALPDVYALPADAFRVVTKEDIDSGSSCLGPLEKCCEVRVRGCHDMAGPIHDLGGSRPPGVPSARKRRTDLPRLMYAILRADSH